MCVCCSTGNTVVVKVVNREIVAGVVLAIVVDAVLVLANRGR